ncbi:HAMP domain-containing sensor histidine kinase [Clostridium sp. AL.422]|uniref:sensor histidine kinase n=1 Tax=Clostridium TaxID=1485 RepID=UPI00293DE1EE|nr:MULTISPECIES: HAMP domain-containing sensor histidine kinase [unclassified Clostridium]MDV4152676.1 HAMP domain-containing sensor histidine kinase [Clostridium sp. AL.422]
MNKELLDCNEFYIKTINYIFFSPEIFVTDSYISNTMVTMQNKLVEENLNIEDFLYVKFTIGLCKFKLNDYFSAIKLFNNLAESEDLKYTPSLTSYLYTILSISYLKIENIDKHINYYNLAINYLENNDFKELLLYLYLNTALIKLEIYNIDELLYSNINNAFKILTEYEGYYSSQALILIGTIYYKYLNLHNIAIDLFNKALSSAEVNDELNVDILVKYNIGCTYLAMGKIHEGINMLKLILKSHNDILPSIFKLFIYSNILEYIYKIDDIFDDTKKFLTLYKNELYNIDSYHFDIYLARYNLINVHYKIIEHESTYNIVLTDLFYYLDNANYVYKSNLAKFNSKDFEFWLEIAYGNLYFALKNYEKALLHHKKALLLSNKIHNESTINLYKLISNDYEKLSNYKDALKYYKTSVNAINNYNNLNENDLYIKLFDEFNNKIVLNSVNNNFFSNLSHELKTPVNIIYSSVQLMGALKDRDLYSLKEYFNKYEKSVKQNCLRMLRLINNLIDITKIDSGTAKLDLILVDIIPFIEDLTLSLIPYTKFKNLSITFDTNVEKLYLKIDTYAFERIILNLLSNAIKFNNVNGSILVSIISSDNNVTISIKDTGIGIPDNLKDLVFNRFYKVDNSFSRNTEGSGVGLALTKELIELHGGTIKINRKYTDGSEFLVNLPAISEKGILTDTNFRYFVDDEKILSELSDIYELF